MTCRACLRLTRCPPRLAFLRQNEAKERVLLGFMILCSEGAATNFAWNPWLAPPRPHSTPVTCHLSHPGAGGSHAGSEGREKRGSKCHWHYAMHHAPLKGIRGAVGLPKLDRSCNCLRKLQILPALHTACKLMQ